MKRQILSLVGVGALAFAASISPAAIAFADQPTDTQSVAQPPTEVVWYADHQEDAPEAAPESAAAVEAPAAAPDQPVESIYYPDHESPESGE